MKLKLFRIILLTSVIICLLGIGYPSLFYGGTIITKQLAGKDLMSKTHEAEITQITVDYLYNNKIEKAEDLKLPEIDPNAWEQNYYYCERIRKREKFIVCLSLLMLTISAFLNFTEKKKFLALTLLLPLAYFCTYYCYVISKGGVNSFLINSSNLGAIFLLGFTCQLSGEIAQKKLIFLKVFTAVCILLTIGGFSQFSGVNSDNYSVNTYEIVSYFPALIMPLLLGILFINKKGGRKNEI